MFPGRIRRSIMFLPSKQRTLTKRTMSSLLTHVKPTSSVFNVLANSAQPYRTDTLDYGCLFAIGQKTIQVSVARVTSYLIDKQFALRTLGLSTLE